MADFTPGPWYPAIPLDSTGKQTQYDPGEEIPIISDESHKDGSIAIVLNYQSFTHLEEEQLKKYQKRAWANARLVAVAPEMFSLLIEALDSLKYVQQAHPGLTGNGVRAERMAKIQSLLARVSGESEVVNG